MRHELEPWRLLPAEQILWEGRPVRGARRDLAWRVGPLLIAAGATIAALFSGLLAAAHMPGSAQLGLVAAYLGLFAVAGILAPRYLHDHSAYAVTDRRVLARRGRTQRWIDRQGMSYARVTWSAAQPGIGHLELVRATPYGPLSRKQRLVLHYLEAPDRVLARIRGVEEVPELGDPELPLTERLDGDERVLWTGSPGGLSVGPRELATTLVGLTVVALGLRYGARSLATIVSLEQGGLPVRSWTWLLFFLATALTCCVISGIGAWLAWRSSVRARALARASEYLVTSRRLLIRRGRTELSVERDAIVDVAAVPAPLGCVDLFLILDAPGARALADGGATRPVRPARDAVPPVLFGLREADRVSALLLQRDPSLRFAA